jgi:hypothetical protein
MKSRTLLFAPPAFAGAFLVAGVLAGDAAGAVLRAENEAGKVLAVLGCLAAASAFQRGDYLRRAWALTATCVVLLLVRDTTIIPGVETALAGPALDPARWALITAANTASVLGTALMARAWSVSGLSSAGRRAWLVIAGVVVSLAATGWPLMHDLQRLAHGDYAAIPFLASDLGDTVSFVLVAPVLDTALELRGGALLWPWALLTAGGLCWIIYDAGWGISALFHSEDTIRVRLVVETFRGLACAFIAVAGVAQRLAIQPAPPSSAERSAS